MVRKEKEKYEKRKTRSRKYVARRNRRVKRKIYMQLRRERRKDEEVRE